MVVSLKKAAVLIQLKSPTQYGADSKSVNTENNIDQYGN